MLLLLQFHAHWVARCMSENKIGFVGAGRLATAIMRGLVEAGAVPPGNFSASSPSGSSFGALRELGVSTTTSNVEVVQRSTVVVLAVKVRARAWRAA